MGYCGLDSWGASDMAADAVSSTIDAMVKVLKREIKDKGNEYNTDGILNVAFFNESFIYPARKEYGGVYSEGLVKLLDDCRVKLEKKIKKASKESNEDWGDKANKDMHIKAYRRLLRKLKATLEEMEQ